MNSQTLTSPGTSESAPRRAKPSITVDNPAIRTVQRRMAQITVITPAIGAAVAVWLAFQTGFGWLEISLLAGMYVATSLGVEVGLHRFFTHKAFDTYPGVALLLGIFGSMAAEGSVLYWTAGHRRHHAHSDTEDDPHSPHVAADRGMMSMLRGLWHSHIGWMMTDKVTNCTLFAKDLLRNQMTAKLHEYYIPLVIAGLLLPGVIGGLVTLTWMGALKGFLWGGLVRMFLVHHSTWSNASFSHMFGGRPFASGDHSANNLWCALPTFGASWQNNHHTFPTSAYLGLKWWQVDLAGYFITAMRAVGLAWNVNGPPAPEQLAARQAS